MADQELSENAEAERYELRIAGELIGTADYSVNGDVVSLTRIYTRPTPRDPSIEAVLTANAVDRIAGDGRKVVPVCSYAAAWFDEHPERTGLLAG